MYHNFSIFSVSPKKGKNKHCHNISDSCQRIWMNNNTVVCKQSMLNFQFASVALDYSFCENEIRQRCCNFCIGYLRNVLLIWQFFCFEIFQFWRCDQSVQSCLVKWRLKKNLWKLIVKGLRKIWKNRNVLREEYQNSSAAYSIQTKLINYISLISSELNSNH